MALRDAVGMYGPFDLIFEATGFAPIVFEAMEALGKNGVLVLASVTSGNQMVQVPAAKDQPGVRSRPQGHGRHGQRQP